MAMPINDITADSRLETGQAVIIVLAVSNEEVKQKYPAGWNTVLPYRRVVAQPQKAQR